jgi:hypothetical protein
VETRKQRFNKINAYIIKHGGWLVSPPGDPEMRLQALPGSPLPAQLAAQGYIIERIGETQRILAHAVTVKFTTRADGELEPLTEGSTKPVTMHTTHARIAIV